MKHPSFKIILLISSFILIISGCSNTQQQDPQQKSASKSTEVTKTASLLKTAPKRSLGTQPNHDIYYEMFVRSFYDSNGDGIGDLKGATEKLDYLKSLGITGIWLMPIYPSPSYHGYDVTNYKSVNPDYGTIKDLDNFVSAAHKRGIKVILDLVLNHTSDQNPWFKDAISSNNSVHRNWYIWKNKNTKGSNLGDWGQPLWHGTAKNQYFGVYSDHMPDLNYNNPTVQKAMINIGQYWLKTVHIDGYRLDGAKYIFNDQPKNLNWWYTFDQSLKKVNSSTFLVGEIWDTKSFVAPYYRSMDSAFDFDLSTKIISVVNSGDAKDLVSSLIDTRQLYNKESNHFIDSTFLTNHDMDRVMSQFLDDKDKAKLAAAILMTLPGDPFIYYGEELGMQGTKPDEHIREPMPWTKDTTSKGTTTWEIPIVNNPSVAAEQNDPNSVLNLYKTLIQERKKSPILMDGDIQPSRVTKYGVLAYKRTLKSHSLLIIHNLLGDKVSFKLSKEELNYDNMAFTTSKKATLHDGLVSLPGYGTVILKMNK